MTQNAPKSSAIAGPLYDLLTAKLPVCTSGQGTLQVAKLADRLRMSHEGVYKWLRAGDVSKRGRRLLVDLGSAADNLELLKGDPLTEDDLRPFS